MVMIYISSQQSRVEDWRIGLGRILYSSYLLLSSPLINYEFL